MLVNAPANQHHKERFEKPQRFPEKPTLDQSIRL